MRICLPLQKIGFNSIGKIKMFNESFFFDFFFVKEKMKKREERKLNVWIMEFKLFLVSFYCFLGKFFKILKENSPEKVFHEFLFF